MIDNFSFDVNPMANMDCDDEEKEAQKTAASATPLGSGSSAPLLFAGFRAKTDVLLRPLPTAFKYMKKAIARLCPDISYEDLLMMSGMTDE